MDDEICRFTADVQLVGYISDNNPSVLSNQSINSFNIVLRSLSGWMAQAVFNYAYSTNLERFHPLVHLPLRNTVLSVLY
jgi:hypothetical protein